MRPAYVIVKNYFSGADFGGASQSLNTLLFILGGALLGIGAGPVTTLHYSYIDDHVSRTKSPAYLSKSY